jgi:bifunctional non-homologous end joining protein LigD
VAASLTAEEPDVYTARAEKARREGKVFLDWLRNSRGATAIASFSTRALAGAPVATPLGWGELDELAASDVHDITNLGDRLATLDGDPWDGFFDLQQAVSAAKLRQARAAAGWPAELETD